MSDLSFYLLNLIGMIDTHYLLGNVLRSIPWTMKLSFVQVLCILAEVSLSKQRNRITMGRLLLFWF